MNLSIVPDLAIEPFSSYFSFDFNLIHLSIRQFHGPISLLYIEKLLFIEVIFDIPPIFIMETGIFILFCLTNNL